MGLEKQGRSDQQSEFNLTRHDLVIYGNRAVLVFIRRSF